jgi:hypothetical protein
VVTFFVTSPYILFSFRAALDDILKEARHYATGHRGATVDPGLPMLGAYCEHFAENYGAIALALSVVGVAVLARRDLRLALVTFAHPIVFIVYMCTQRVFFERNVVAVHIFIAIGLALALIELPGVLAALLARRWPAFRVRAGVVCVGLVVGLFLVGVPWSRSVYAYASGIEPRNEAARWVNRLLDKKTVVIVDTRVDIDPRTLSKRFRVVEITLRRESEKVKRLRKKQKRVVVISRPAQKKQYAALLRSTKEVALFDTPPERPGGVKIRALAIIERR